MTSLVGHATAADGTDLLVRTWQASAPPGGGQRSGRAWASLLIVHGLGEHSGRYEHVGDQMAAAGLDVQASIFAGRVARAVGEDMLTAGRSTTTTSRSG